ncbi:F-box protein SKIP22-like [Brachypodium distachyon]|uniref:F-box protein SKIP22-like n=1 Tax=Brachypodium distachyon TaxID=15368 RepID=UPI0001C7687C|nr:F-box protein SKIP22-like [Brachypodium distachyon]|eukprot:XP_003558438.1 F-box protein SKIP22-like [Brachypodium distachyon]
MKLRLRSMDARGGVAETHRVQLPDTATLSDVKAFLAAKLSDAQPVPAESVRLSLNRSEELLSPDPSATLVALGLASGDLLHFTLSPLRSHPPPPQALPRNPSPDAIAISGIVACSTSPGEAGRTSSASLPQTIHIEPASSSPPSTLRLEPTLPVVSDSPDVVMAEAVDAAKSSPSFVIGLLKREMEAENAGSTEATVIHRFIIALHAALVDAGFLAANPPGCSLGFLKDWASGALPTLTVKYTLPEIVSVLPVAEEGKIVVLNYSLMPNFVMIYGCVPGAQSEVHRLCLELPKLAPLLYLDSNDVGEVEEKEILDLWRVLKDEMCLPLMVSLCRLNGLPLPPCLMALPGDLKAKILEFVPGVDLARVECTCKELGDLAADDNLWKTKCELEFKACGENSRLSKNWKQKFVAAWTVKVAASKRLQKRPSPRFWSYGWGSNPHGPLNFPVIGGDSDRLPFSVNHNFLGRSFGNQRRNISPSCNFGGGRQGFP